MKIDITRKLITLNDKKLKEEIHKFEYLTNKKSCLFMSNDTLKILFPYCASAFNSGVMYEFEGRKIYQKDDLGFGEVDIR